MNVSGGKLKEGDRVRCNAWLLDQAAKIPYLVSTVWQDSLQPDDSMINKILDMPDYEDMEVTISTCPDVISDNLLAGLPPALR